MQRYGRCFADSNDVISEPAGDLAAESDYVTYVHHWTYGVCRIVRTWESWYETEAEGSRAIGSGARTSWGGILQLEDLEKQGLSMKGTNHEEHKDSNMDDGVRGSGNGICVCGTDTTRGNSVPVLRLSFAVLQPGSVLRSGGEARDGRGVEFVQHELRGDEPGDETAE